MHVIPCFYKSFFAKEFYYNQWPSGEKRPATGRAASGVTVPGTLSPVFVAPCVKDKYTYIYRYTCIHKEMTSCITFMQPDTRPSHSIIDTSTV